MNKRGATDVFKTTFFGLILFVLFSAVILTVVIDFGGDYGRSASEIGGGSLNLSLFQDSANTVNNNSQTYRDRFESGAVDDVDDPSGLFSVVTDMISMITTPFTLLSQVLVNILKFPPLVINVILGLLAISLILAIWSLLRKGD